MDTQVGLPEFVEHGTYEDHSWRFAASKKEEDREPHEQQRYLAGPLLHPYGPNAYRDELLIPDGGFGAEPRTLVRYFPSEEARNLWVQQHEPERMKMMKPPSEPAPDADVAAQDVGLKSMERVQGSDGKGKARTT